MGAGASALNIQENLLGKFYHKDIGNILIEKEKVVFCKDNGDTNEEKEFPIEWVNPFTFHISLEENVMTHPLSSPASTKNEMHAELWVFSSERDGYFQINECFGSNTVEKVFSIGTESSTFFTRSNVAEDKPAEKDILNELGINNEISSNLVGKFKGFTLGEGDSFVSMDDGKQLKIEWINPFVFLSSTEDINADNSSSNNNENENLHEKKAWIYSFMLDSYLEIDSEENCVTNAEREPHKVHKRITFCKDYEMTPDEQIETNMEVADIETEENTTEEEADTKEEKNEKKGEEPQTEMDSEATTPAPDATVANKEDGPLVVEQKGKSKSTINFEKKNITSINEIPDSEINAGA